MTEHAKMIRLTLDLTMTEVATLALTLKHRVEWLADMEKHQRSPALVKSYRAEGERIISILMKLDAALGDPF